MNTIAVDNNYFDTIASVDISLSNWVDNILSCFLSSLDIWSNLLDQEIMADKLVIKNGCTKLRARTLNTVSELIVRSDGIISVDDTLAVFIKAAQQIEGVEGHKAAWVKSVSKKLS